MTARQATFPRIVRDAAIVGGEPIVRGTRVPVRIIVQMYQHYHDVERLCRAFPRLDAEAIQEALAYYEGHRDEIDSLIAAESEEAGVG